MRLMSKLDKSQVKHLAKLSRLKLSDPQIDELLSELNNILDFVKKLQTVDTDGVEPTAQVTGLTSVMRPDTIKDYGTTREDLLSNSPAQQDGFIKVRRVL